MIGAWRTRLAPSTKVSKYHIVEKKMTFRNVFHLFALSFVLVLTFIHSVRIKVPGTTCGTAPNTVLCDALPVGIDGQLNDNGQGRSPTTCDSKVVDYFCPYGMVTYGFGRNQYGQLGLGDTVDRDTPTPLATAYAKIVKLDCSAQSSFLLWAGLNTLYSWGRADHGQLGQVPSELHDFG